MKLHRTMISSIALLAVSIVFPAGAWADLTVFSSDFEASSGFTLGALSGQCGWPVSAGGGYQVVANDIVWAGAPAFLAPPAPPPDGTVILIQ